MLQAQFLYVAILNNGGGNSEFQLPLRYHGAQSLQCLGCPTFLGELCRERQNI